MFEMELYSTHECSNPGYWLRHRGAPLQVHSRTLQVENKKVYSVVKRTMRPC